MFVQHGQRPSCRRTFGTGAAVTKAEKINPTLRRDACLRLAKACRSNVEGHSFFDKKPSVRNAQYTYKAKLWYEVSSGVENFY